VKRALVGLLLSVSFASGPLWAEPGSELERAKESFRAGATAYAAGDYLAAIQALEAAYQLTPLPAIAFSLGQAERRQYFVDHGRPHLVRAIALFRRYIEVAPSGSRRADALEALSQLEPLSAASPEPSSVPARAEEARRTRLLVTTDAPGARITLDGSGAAASPLIREVEPGKHRVQVEAPGFYPAQREVTAVAGELVLAQMPLRERLSILSVWTSRAAEIYIDGAFVSQGGPGIVIQLSSGPHRLAVGQKGYRVAVRELNLTRGNAQTVRVELEQTSQRFVSDALFVAGGASLWASLVLSSLTVRAEGSAEEFLGRRAHRNVSGAELYRYDSTIAERDRYRLGTTVALAASAGFFITGLFLHELDQPNPQLLFRMRSRSDPRLPAPPSTPRAARVQLAPVAVGTGFGAMLGGTF